MAAEKKEPKLVKWDDSYYVKAFTLAKDGLSDGDIATSLGFKPQTLLRWLNAKPALREALKEARGGGTTRKPKVGTFREFVAERLPPKGRKLWRKMIRLEEMSRSASRELRKEALAEEIASSSVEIRQHLFLKAYVKFNFVKARAMVACGLDDKTVTRWCKDDAFAEVMKNLYNLRGDFFEGALMKLVEEGNPQAIIFANRTVNRDRGYDHKIEVKVSGEVEHSHRDASLALEGLSPALKRQILEEYRRKKATPQLQDNSNVQDAEFEVKKGKDAP